MLEPLIILLELVIGDEPATEPVILLSPVVLNRERPLVVLLDPDSSLLVTMELLLLGAVALEEDITSGEMLDGEPVGALEGRLVDGMVKLVSADKEIVLDIALPVALMLVRSDPLELCIDSEELSVAVIGAERLLSTLSNPHRADVIFTVDGSYPSIRLYNLHTPVEYVKPTQTGP